MKILKLLIALVLLPSLCFANGLQDLTSTKVSVGSTTTEVLAASTTNEYVALVNDSDETIYIGIGGNAVLNEGIRLNANGGSVTFKYPQIPQQAINAICTSGSKNLTVISGR